MRINRLYWDDENIEHIVSRHNISPTEVEQVCFGIHYACSAKYKRKVLYGSTVGGRYIMVVLEKIKENAFRVITARSMTGVEKKKYNSVMKQSGK